MNKDEKLKKQLRFYMKFFELIFNNIYLVVEANSGSVKRYEVIGVKELESGLKWVELKNIETGYVWECDPDFLFESLRNGDLEIEEI